MSRRSRTTALVGAFLIAASSMGGAAASSHREAPLISRDATGDNTDTYAFMAPDRPGFVVLAASWIPFEGPEGGPNYWEWNDSYTYEIHVDNNGDAIPDVTYALTSKVSVGNPDTFLYNTGPISQIGDKTWNRTQSITVKETILGGATTTLVDNQITAPSNIGGKSIPNFPPLQMSAIRTVGTGPDQISIYGGQTDDPFFADLQVFDLLTLRGQAAPIGYPTGSNVPQDSLSGFNVHSLVVEVPVAHVTAAGDPVIGVWADTLDQNGKQISRLGMPLTNEVVLPMGLKDTFNSIPPSADLGAYGQLQKSVEDPEVGTLLCGLYKVPLPGSGGTCDSTFTAGTPRTGRGDIFDVFLTGMKLAKPFTITTKTGPKMLPAGFNVNQPAKVQPADMIRLNTAITGDLCSPMPSRLGVLGGDACGFPNGRRLTDDVLDIELLAVAGAAYQVLDARDASFSFNPALLGALTDGVDTNDKPFQTVFPYYAFAQAGRNHSHQNQTP